MVKIIPQKIKPLRRDFSTSEGVFVVGYVPRNLLFVISGFDRFDRPAPFAGVTDKILHRVHFHPRGLGAYRGLFRRGHHRNIDKKA